MPRGPADRPLRKADEEAALQAAMRRALEQGAAPAAATVPVPEAPSFAPTVAPPEPIRGVRGVSRLRGARAVVLAKRPRRKEAPRIERVADPRGRGGKLDLRV